MVSWNMMNGKVFEILRGDHKCHSKIESISKLKWYSTVCMTRPKKSAIAPNKNHWCMKNPHIRSEGVVIFPSWTQFFKNKTQKLIALSVRPQYFCLFGAEKKTKQIMTLLRNAK